MGAQAVTMRVFIPAKKPQENGETATMTRNYGGHAVTQLCLTLMDTEAHMGFSRQPVRPLLTQRSQPCFHIAGEIIFHCDKKMLENSSSATQPSVSSRTSVTSLRPALASQAPSKSFFLNSGVVSMV